MRRILSILLVLLLALSLPLTVFADTAKGTTLRLASFDGTVSMTNASGADVTPRADMRLYSGYGVATEKGGSAYISLDGTKAVKLDASSKANIQKSGKQLEVQLLAGQLYFNVEAPLAADETLNIRSSTMVTGVRGSFGWVTKTEMGLMHGHVTLTCTNPDTGEERVTEVYSGEMVYFEQDASAAAADPALLEIDFVKQAITNEVVPAIVVEEIANDETLQAQVAQDVETVDVPSLLGSLEEKQAAEAAAAEEAEQAAEEAAAAQEAEIVAAVEYYSATDEGQDAGYTGGTVASSHSGSGSSSTPTSTTVTGTGGNVTSDLTSALKSSVSVTFSGTGTADSLSIESGKTLTIADGAELTLSGTSSNLSSNTLINNGKLTISGTFNNGGASAGRFVNNGTLNISGTFNNHYNGIFTGNAPSTGSITQYYLVTYNTNGGSTVEATEFVSGLSLKSVIPSSSPTRDNYTFAGWFTDEALTYAVVADTTLTSNITLYAKWTETSTYTVTLPRTVASGTNGVSYTVQGVADTYTGVTSSGTDNVYTVSKNGLFMFTVSLPSDSGYAMGPYSTAMINYDGTTGETVGVSERSSDWTTLTCSITVDENKSGLGMDEDLYQIVSGTFAPIETQTKYYVASGTTLTWPSTLSSFAGTLYNYGTITIGAEGASSMPDISLSGTLYNFGTVTNYANLHVMGSGYIAGNSFGGTGNIYSGASGETAYTVYPITPTSAGVTFVYAIGQSSSASGMWNFAENGSVKTYQLSVNSATPTAGEIYALASDKLTTGVTDDYTATAFVDNDTYKKTSIKVKTYDAANGFITPDGADGNTYKVNSEITSIYDVSGTPESITGAAVATVSAGDQLTVIYYYIDSSDGGRVITTAWLTAKGT